MIARQRMSKLGFTLMEIMVVIIVIAVLASVAGPMIGSITDQGKASACKASMQNIKTALVNYNNDLGRFPHGGNTLDSSNINLAWNAAVGLDISNNVLSNQNVGVTVPANWNQMGIAAYTKRWKGPYMDADPAEFMMDPWEARVLYTHSKNMIWLHSMGPDGASEFANVINANYTGDDISMSVTRTKF